ncbi:hypothetical protein, partial [Acetobacter pasteurianus]|uniref:hypothetical protein n=1 Tax=Acetobacter pasteurianus TaxID=438 RepID=UPI001BDC07DA
CTVSETPLNQSVGGVFCVYDGEFIDLYYECSVKLSIGVLTIYRNVSLMSGSYRPNVENTAYEQSD